MSASYFTTLIAWSSSSIPNSFANGINICLRVFIQSLRISFIVAISNNFLSSATFALCLNWIILEFISADPFIDVGEEAARGFAVEARGRDELIVTLLTFWPGL